MTNVDTCGATTKLWNIYQRLVLLLVTAIRDERPLLISGETSQLSVLPPRTPCPPGHFPGRIVKSVRGTHPAHTAAAAPPPVDQGFAWTSGGAHGPLVVAAGYGRGQGRRGSHGACGTAPRLPQEWSALPQRASFPAQLEKLKPVHAAWRTVC